MSNPFQNKDRRWQDPEACRRHGVAAILCQPCHFLARRKAAAWKCPHESFVGGRSCALIERSLACVCASRTEGANAV
jgi:hypothetical protein